MTLLVDRAIWSKNGRRFAHLVSDTSYDELHAFAAALGLPRRAFHGDHYDLPGDRRDDAIALGAEPVDARQLVRRLRQSGLRRQRRQLGRQVVAGLPLPPVAARPGGEEALAGEQPREHG